MCITAKALKRGQRYCLMCLTPLLCLYIQVVNPRLL